MRKMPAVFVLLSILFVQSTCIGADVSNTPNYDNKGTLSFALPAEGEEVFQVTYNNEGNSWYLLVTLKNGTQFKIWDCGKIEKLVWKEINPNEDNLFMVVPDTFTMPPTLVPHTTN